MDKHSLVELLGDLDRSVSGDHELIVIGGAAMILHFGAERATRDMDVLPVSGDRDDLRKAIKNVAAKHDLPEDWINEATKGFADILPRDFAKRLNLLALPLDHIRVFALGRAEQVAMKIVALREQDLEDLDLLMPLLTQDERRVLIEIMHHVAAFREDWAQRIRYFLLEQGWQID